MHFCLVFLNRTIRESGSGHRLNRTQIRAFTHLYDNRNTLVIEQLLKLLCLGERHHADPLAQCAVHFLVPVQRVIHQAGILMHILEEQQEHTGIITH